MLAEAYSTTKLLLVHVDAASSPGRVLERMNTRALRTLSRLQKAQPAEVLEALVLRWSRLEEEQKVALCFFLARASKLTVDLKIIGSQLFGADARTCSQRAKHCGNNL